jgi:hypothetical protein
MTDRPVADGSCFSHQHADDLLVLVDRSIQTNPAPGGKSGQVSHVPVGRSFSYSVWGMLPRHGFAGPVAHGAPA